MHLKYASNGPCPKLFNQSFHASLGTEPCVAKPTVSKSNATMLCWQATVAGGCYILREKGRVGCPGFRPMYLFNLQDGQPSFILTVNYILPIQKKT